MDDIDRSRDPLLRVTGLVKHFQTERKSMFARNTPAVRAVDGIDFDLWRGETLGIVGESGCGKSTVAKSLLRLVEPDAGSALFEGRDLFRLDRKSMRELRKHIQIVFQDPFSSLNPRMRVGEIIGEPFEVFPEVLPRAQRAHPCRGIARTRGTASNGCQALSTPVLRRTASAHRHRPRPRT
jgi:oligopeptide transport system ATP-binding protein